MIDATVSVPDGGGPVQYRAGDQLLILDEGDNAEIEVTGSELAAVHAALEAHCMQHDLEGAEITVDGEGAWPELDLVTTGGTRSDAGEGVLAVACPYCDAPPDEPCKTSSGDQTDPHKDRQDAIQEEP